MNTIQNSGYDGLRASSKTMIEEDQSPLVCLYFDKVSQKVFIMADSQSLKKIRKLQALVDIENVLKCTHEEGQELGLFDQKFEAERPWYFSCRQGRAGLSQHSCHVLKPQFQLSWEKNLSGCFEDRTPIDVNNARLPREILRSVFEYLNTNDLKNVILVSKYWKSVAGEPGLWKGFDLPKKCRSIESNFVKFFRDSISSKLQDLTLSNFSFQLNDNHFKNLLGLELRSVTIRNVDLFNVSDEHLAQLVNNCKVCVIAEYPQRIKLKNSNVNVVNVLGLNKLKAIFRKMETGTKLKTLTLACVVSNKTLDLSFIPSSTLANALNRIEELTLKQVKLRSNQLKTIFDYMSVKTKLKLLHLQSLDFVNVDIEIFDAAFSSSLTSLVLVDIKLDDIKLLHVFENLDKSCKLETLVISQLDLTSIPSKLLARVVTKVKCTSLENGDIRSDQLEEIFSVISEGGQVIKSLNIEVDDDLQDINSENLARAVNKLNSFDFGSLDDLSESQTQEVFKIMSEKTNLKMLGTPWCQLALECMEHIAAVHPDTLAKAIHNLEEVRLDFEDSKLSLFHYIAIFKGFGGETKLKKVWSQGQILCL